MRRRTLLALAGTGVAAALAGCTGQDGTPTDGDGTARAGSAPFEHPGTMDATFATNGDYPPDEAPGDGYPPAFDDAPPSPDADPSSFETLSVNGETVRLAPIDVVRAWYRRREARFVDARGPGQYERAHVYGAVLSTAQQESAGGGIEAWPTGDRAVTYCGCPHHLSSVRAAGLQKAGFSRVFALDDGFGEWANRGYPMDGTQFAQATRQDVSEWTLRGTVPARYAGEYAWAAAGRQYEAAPIRGDGSFTLRLRFADVTGESLVRVATPAYAVERPLAELAAGPIDGD